MRPESRRALSWLIGITAFFLWGMVAFLLIDSEQAIFPFLTIGELARANVFVVMLMLWVLAVGGMVSTIEGSQN